MAAKTISLDKKSKGAGSTNGEVITATNGQKYLQKDGKVKKLNDLSQLKSTELDLVSDYKKMTADLYRYIKDKEAHNKLVSLAYKDGTVLFRRYKIKYTSGGIQIIDIQNYNRSVKYGLEPFPTAEQVYEVVKVSKVDQKQIDRKKEEREIKVNKLVQKLHVEVKHTNIKKLIDRDAKLLFDDLKNDTDIDEVLKEEFKEKLIAKYPKLQPIEVIDFNALRKKALSFCRYSKSAEDLIHKLMRFIPNKSFNTFLNKKIRKYLNKEIRRAQFVEDVIALIKDDSVFEVKRDPAPKFVPRPLFYIDEVLEETETTVTFRNDKTGDFTVAKSEVLLRDLLQADERFHVAIHKYLQKEMTIEEITLTPYIRDKYVCLNYADLKVHSHELYEWAEDLLMGVFESLNPLDILYRNDIKFEKGERIGTRFAGLCEKKTGEVIKYENGWRVRYEDGTVDYLFKGQIIKRLN